MIPEHANQIAELLNTRNELTTEYTEQMILDKENDFIYELNGNVVVACIEAKRVQWYQWEVCHLTVRSENSNQGLGSLMIQNAEKKALKGNARIIQCTIRRGNLGSERAFKKNGYRWVSEFYYPVSGNMVSVWQKVVSMN